MTEQELKDFIQPYLDQAQAVYAELSEAKADERKWRELYLQMDLKAKKFAHEAEMYCAEVELLRLEIEQLKRENKLNTYVAHFISPDDVEIEGWTRIRKDALGHYRYSKVFKAGSPYEFKFPENIKVQMPFITEYETDK